jgi:zinc protease
MIRRMLLRAWFVLLAFPFMAAGSAPEADNEPVIRTLRNGLTVVLQEDHSAPVVAIQYWVKAGSRAEMDREAGITHLIEHMIFKGTPSRGVGEVAREIESAGGEINAYTSFDYTVYHVTIASRFAQTGLEVLTDAVRNSLFDAEELKREKKVVLEELKMREDRPAGKLNKALFAAAYRVHPYRRPIIGYRDTVANLSRADLLAYVKRLYVPQNMVLVLTGDFDRSAMFARVEALLGDWPSRAPDLPELSAEPPQGGLRTVVLREPASEVHLKLAFHIPDAYHADTPALDVLAWILGMGDSSRLERKIRDRSLVHTISAYSYTPEDPGLFWIQATLDPEKLNEALARILGETFLIGQAGVSAAELAKARLNIEADFLLGKETMQERAHTLGYFQTVFGDVNQEEAYLEAVRGVTIDDVKRVAQKYLTPRDLTAAVLMPGDGEVTFTSEDLKKIVSAASPEPQNKKVGTAQHTGGDHVVHQRLDNGMIVLIKERKSVPSVAIEVVFLGGSRFEQPSDAGISTCTARLLSRGTQTRSAERLAEEVEAMAGSLTGYSGRNSVGLRAEFLSRFFPQAMELFADVLRHPAFDNRELGKERQKMIAAVLRERDKPSDLAIQLFRRTLFKVHPYGLRHLGTEASLQSLTSADIRAFYERVFKPDNAVLTIVGDIPVEDALQHVRRLFGDWRSEPFKAPEVVEEPPLVQNRMATREVPKQQVHIVLGFPGTEIGAADQYPLEVLDTVLSGQGGRLFRELRDRRGLAYVVTSFTQVGLDPGFFGTYIATAPTNRDAAIEGLKAQLTRLTRDLIAPDELERAKRYIVGRYEIGLQSNDAQALTMGLDERYGLGYDYGDRYIERIQAVQREDVLAVAKKYIDLDRCVLVMVGPDVESMASPDAQGEGFVLKTAALK